MAILQAIKGPNPGQLIPVPPTKAILGRHPDCDIVLDVGAVSRQHAQILQIGADFYVEDLHSRNGTFVNGDQIQGRTRLKDCDQVKICDLVFTFHLQAPEPGMTVSVPDTTMAMMVEDDTSGSGSKIMSTLDVGSSGSGVRLKVNPELKLKALIDITRSLSKALDLDEVLNKTLDTLFKIFVQADRGVIALKVAPTGPLVPRAVKHRRPDAEETIRISRTIVNQVMNTKEAILTMDAVNDDRFNMSQSIADFRIRSMMCAPLLDSDGNPLGIIEIDSLDQRSRFQQDDLDLLASVATVAAFAVENAQLHETLVRQKKLERDLELAHRVQQRLLPGSPPELPGFSFFDFYEPANLVGGDYYDYFELPGGRLAVVLADVSGKGMPAAILVAKLSSDIGYSLASEPVPAKAIEYLNRKFVRGGWEDRFVTLLVAVLDPGRKEITLVNAGHMAPILRYADGSVESVGEEEASLPIGVDIDAQYEQFTVTLSPGDSLIAFTDGISEAMNVAGECYGFDRLFAQLKKSSPNVLETGKELLADVKRFVGKHPQSDDMCLLCLGRIK
jgi:serine phosphatase RsbU (regulator of sigma subunit)